MQQHELNLGNFKLGRRRPVAQGPHFKLKNYLKTAIPNPPTACDYAKYSLPSLQNLYLNDELGDCVIAGMAHVEGVLTGNADPTNPAAMVHFSKEEILHLYSKIGGYVPGDKNTDRGCDEQLALNYWMHKGIKAGGKNKIAGWMKVDAKDLNEVRVACWLFENLYFGVELPDKWINPFPQDNGFTWGVEGPTNEENGHCFVGVGYNSMGVFVNTWGLIGLITNDAIAKYASSTDGAGELYVVISKDAIGKANKKAPNGFDWSQLVADFDSMGGNI